VKKLILEKSRRRKECVAHVFLVIQQKSQTDSKFDELRWPQALTVVASGVFHNCQVAARRKTAYFSVATKMFSIRSISVLMGRNC